MIVPHESKLESQIFTENKIEFLWLFDDQQFILGVNKDGSVYIEAGDINSEGDYIEGSHWCELLPSHGPVTKLNGDKIEGTIHMPPPSLADEVIWNDPKYNFCNYNFFSNGKELVPLVEEVISYFKQL